MFNKIKNVIKQQLAQGVSVEKLSQSLTCGVLIGCFPLIGFTTGLAALFGFMFKLNHVVVQTANYLMYPIQILLIPVYIKLSGLIIDIHDLPIRPDLIVKSFVENPIYFMQQYGFVTLIALGIWFVASFILYFILQKVFQPIITKLYQIKGG